MTEIKVGQKYKPPGWWVGSSLPEHVKITEVHEESDTVCYVPGIYGATGSDDEGISTWEDRWILVEDVEDNQLSPNAYQSPNGVEVRSVSSTGAEKGVKRARFSLLPMVALTEVAEHYGVGATKYEDHNMRRGYEWSKSYDALMRHTTQFWSGEDRDEETGSKHLAAVVFHALTLMEFMETHPEFDDRYKLAK